MATSRLPFKEQEALRPDFLSASFAPQFELTKAPDPDWTPGQGLNSLPLASAHHSSQPRKELDPDTMPKLYAALISGVAPRPIAFLSTTSLNGTFNLAPYSFFNLVSGSPPVLMISISPSSNPGGKDSYQNIISTKEFVVSMISETFLESANYTSVDAPSEVSEWALSGLTPVKSTVVGPPRVGESVFSMECTLHHEWKVTDDEGKETGAHVVFGRIRKIHVLESAWDSEKGVLKQEGTAIVSRLGGISYGRTTQGYEVGRPFWEAEKDRPEVVKALA